MPDLSEQDTLAHLLATGTGILGMSGEAAITVRYLAELASVSATTLQHHFPYRSGLLAAIYQEALQRDSNRLMQLGMAARQANIAGDTAALALVQGIINDACGANSARTLARVAALTGISRNKHSHRQMARKWVVHSHTVYTQVLQGIAPSPRKAASFLLEFITGMELMSLGCRQNPRLPLLNAELIQHAVGLFSGKTQPHTHCPAWFRLCASEALSQSQQERLKASSAKVPRSLHGILSASARVLAGDGPRELTYRNVAKAAGVAPSLVTYHFRSRHDLLYAAYRYIHNQFARDSMANSVPTKSTGLQATLELVIDTPAGPRPAYMASLEAIVACAYEQDMADMAFKTRMTRGVYYLHPNWDADSRLSAIDFSIHAVSIWALGATLMAEACYAPPVAIQHLRRRFSEAEHVFLDMRLLGKTQA